MVKLFLPRSLGNSQQIIGQNYLSFVSLNESAAEQADRKHCTDDFSRQINFTLIFKILKLSYL